MEQLVWAIALSTHMGLEGSYNEVHPHVRFYDDGAIAGAYLNSVDRLSVYGGYRLEYNNWGAEFTITTGYPAHGALAPQVRGTYDFGDRVRFFAAPGIEDNGLQSTVGTVLGVEFIID